MEIEELPMIEASVVTGEMDQMKWTGPLDLIVEPESKVLFTFHRDGRVELGPDLNLESVLTLDIVWLRALREIVNTAIYDKEKKGVG